MFSKTSLCVVSALLLGAAPAVSATLDFTDVSTGAGGFYEELVLSLGDGVTATVTAGTYTSDAVVDTDVDGTSDLVVSKTVNGLGVILSDLSDLPGLNGASDLLTFSFSSSVLLDSVSFGGVDSNDDYDIFFDGVLAYSDIALSGATTPSFGSVELTSFSIGADELTDNFTLLGLDVETVPVPVPLPAGLPLLLTGFGALAIAKRKRQKATA